MTSSGTFILRTCSFLQQYLGSNTNHTNKNKTLNTNIYLKSMENFKF